MSTDTTDPDVDDIPAAVAAPPDLEALLADATSSLRGKEEHRDVLKAGVADIEQHLSDLEAEASAWAEAKGSGAPVDEARGKLLARETAVAKEELALSIDGLRVGQGAVDKAATAKLTAEWHVAQRDARLACGPQGEAEIKLAEASAAWWLGRPRCAGRRRAPARSSASSGLPQSASLGREPGARRAQHQRRRYPPSRFVPSRRGAGRHDRQSSRCDRLRGARTA